jgi:alkanesulfonate monooxygenase SsuD/methylene tetrahydromethanopterin reductase-like flavin-dependent oxidoreductase (luciferase family)
MKRGLFVAPFDELADPALVADLAAEAEGAGWDGFFVWDHVVYSEVSDVADPWITLTAIAMRTERMTIGPLVTPVARRRPHKLARETATLQRLSGGRLVLGVGLGGDRHGEFAFPGEEQDPRERARLLDEGLERLEAYWGGELQPEARVPIWVAGRYPNRRPVRRAARYDGLFPIDLPGPEALAELVAELPEGHDVVVTNPPGTDEEPWERAGATWHLTGFGRHPTAAGVRAAIGAASGT